MSDRNRRRVSVASGVVLIATSMVYGGAHTWRVNELFSDSTGTIQFIEIKECCGGNFETGVNGQSMTSNSRIYTLSGPAISQTANKTLLIATPAFAALPGVPTPNYVIPVGSVPFFSTSGDTVAYSIYHSLTFAAGQLPTDGVHSLEAGLATPCNTPTNFAGATTTINLACGTKGDINGNTLVDGDDIAGFVRVVSGAPAGGDNVMCAEYCTGSVVGNIAAFVADLLS